MDALAMTFEIVLRGETSGASAVALFAFEWLGMAIGVLARFRECVRDCAAVLAWPYAC